MAATKQTAAALASEEKALADMLEADQIDTDIYLKGIVRLAAEQMSVGEVGATHRLLRQVNLGYINTALPAHMQADTPFRQLVTYMCEQLVAEGYVYMGREWNLPVTPGEA